MTSKKQCDLCDECQMNQSNLFQPVLVCDYGQNRKWTRGSILNSTGPLSCSMMVVLANVITTNSKVAENK